ncbi:MAG: hypothetical protein HGA85_08540, partial [Nanoarchaeota archaeon]|nr:hypothetical protein [Nanoarchaeota archaeon]
MIAGLPGIGSVGKIVSDFLITETGAVKLADLFSYFMPNSVFVQENNLIDLPKISFYYKESGGTKLLILTGDTQPTTDRGTYLFCEYVLDFFEKHKCKEIITLGGIGLSEIPKAPKVYCTGNSKEMVEIYMGDLVGEKVYDEFGNVFPLLIKFIDANDDLSIQVHPNDELA